MPERIVSTETTEVIDSLTGMPWDMTATQVQYCGTCRGSGKLTYRRKRRYGDRRFKVYHEHTRQCCTCHGSGDGTDGETRITMGLSFDLVRLPDDMFANGGNEEPVDRHAGLG